MPLTQRQLKVRDFILAYQAEYRERPMYKQIMAALEIRSSRTVHKIIKQLEKAGELRLEYARPGNLP
jgi:SOS-response transcriptional repressor LexA